MIKNQENNRMYHCEHTYADTTYPSFFPGERSTLIISHWPRTSRFYDRYCFYRREEELAERKIGPIDSGMLRSALSKGDNAGVFVYVCESARVFVRVCMCVW